MEEKGRRLAALCIGTILLVLPHLLILSLDTAMWRTRWNLVTGILDTTVFLDLPIAMCLCHWHRPRWFVLGETPIPSPLPWLIFTLTGWACVAGGMYFSIKLGHGPDNGFAAVCAYLFGWAYIWLTMVPIGLVYLLVLAVKHLIRRAHRSG